MTSLLCAVVLSAAAAAAAAPAKSEEDAIRDVQSRQQEAWNKRDAKAYASLFAEDADAVTITGWKWKGREEIEARLGQGFGFMFRDSTMTIGDVEVRMLSPAIAVARVRFTLEGVKVMPGRPAFPGEGIQMQVLQQYDGRWLIVAFQNTGRTPEAPFPQGPPRP
jgi:uncharacterized protein (TIGR02246 family)